VAVSDNEEYLSENNNLGIIINQIINKDNNEKEGFIKLIFENHLMDMFKTFISNMSKHSNNKLGHVILNLLNLYTKKIIGEN
jgi:hypothetical protein